MLPSLPAPDPARPYLTKAEAARWANVSLRTFNRWIQEGLIPSTKIGGEVRVDPLAMSAALVAATMGRIPSASAVKLFDRGECERLVETYRALQERMTKLHLALSPT